MAQVLVPLCPRQSPGRIPDSWLQASQALTTAVISKVNQHIEDLYKSPFPYVTPLSHKFLLSHPEIAASFIFPILSAFLAQNPFSPINPMPEKHNPKFLNWYSQPFTGWPGLTLAVLLPCPFPLSTPKRMIHIYLHKPHPLC